MSRMYPHIATVWQRGEEVDGKAQWTASVLQEVRVEQLSAQTRALMGVESKSASWFFVSGTQDFEAIKPGDRIIKDFVCKTDPPYEALLIDSIETVGIGPAKAHHWEVLAK